MKSKAWMTAVAFAVGLGMYASVARAEEDETLSAVANARFKEGVALLGAKKFAQARVSFLQILALEPGNPKVLINLAIAEHGSGHYVDALKHLKEYYRATAQPIPPQPGCLAQTPEARDASPSCAQSGEAGRARLRGTQAEASRASGEASPKGAPPYGSGHFVEGMRHLKEYKASPRAEWNKDRELKQRLYDDLWAVTGHLKIAADIGVEVLVDGTKYGKAPLADTVDTKPGNHYVAAGAKSAEVTVAAGETKEINLATPAKAPAAAVPPPATQATPPPPMPEPPPMDSESGEGSTRYLVSGSLVALGVVGVGLGIGYTVAANNASRNLTDLSKAPGSNYSCYGSSSSNGTCSSLAQYKSTRIHDRNIATGSFISGGMLLAAGVVSYLIWPKESSHSPSSASSFVPWVGKDGVGLAYGKEF